MRSLRVRRRLRRAAKRQSSHEYRVRTDPEHRAGGNVETGHAMCASHIFRACLQLSRNGRSRHWPRHFPDGEVGIHSRVLDGPALLVPSAMNAINQWKFRPNVVRGEVTWSRVRALVRFNADGTTAVDFAPAILADNFGDPGTPRSAASAFPRPASALECKSVLR